MIEITDEIRAAVLAEMCENSGHQYTISTALSLSEDRPRHEIGGTDGKLPHVSCVRCKKSWIVVPGPGDSYDRAEQDFLSRLKDCDPLKSK